MMRVTCCLSRVLQSWDLTIRHYDQSNLLLRQGHTVSLPSNLTILHKNQDHLLFEQGLIRQWIVSKCKKELTSESNCE